MRKASRVASLVVGGAVALLAACSNDLNITNENAPDRVRAIKNPGDVATVAATSFRHWYIANQHIEPNEAFAVMSDAMTSSFGNFGMRFNSNEPRIAYENLTTSGDVQVAQRPWRLNYQALGEANDVLVILDGGMKITDNTNKDVTDMYRALATFVQGASLGNIALIFDKGFVVDEKVALPAPATFVPYKDVAAAALAKFDAVIALSKNASWKVPAEYTTADLTLTGPRLAELASTMAARLLAYMPRDAAENAQVDWAKVLQYAKAGIKSSVQLTGDGGNIWYDYAKGYSNYNEWMRVDMRLIHLMDPNSPAQYPNDCSVVPKATSADKRLETDFTYYPNIPFQAARGCYHWSNWAHERYANVSYLSATPFTGPSPVILLAENDLLIAEAIVRTNGDMTEAATLVNKTRVGRGELTPVAPTAAELLAAIQYEQDIELLNTGGGLQYYNRRRIDGLQPGTPRHLPVPASELEIHGIAPYTFGGQAPNPVYSEK